jgi:hypothetical protein
MPFCPKCRYEYRLGINVCPDCNEPLVPALPPENESASEYDESKYKNWVCIGRLHSNEYAELVKEALITKDIPAVVLSSTGHYGQIGGMLMASGFSKGSGFFLLVPADYVDDADQEAEAILGDEWKQARIVRKPGRR